MEIQSDVSVEIRNGYEGGSVDEPEIQSDENGYSGKLEGECFPAAAKRIRSAAQLREFFGENIEGVGRLVRARCYRTPEKAEDVMQETYPRMLKALEHTPDGIREPWAMLNTVARHIAVDEIRRSATQHRRFKPLYEDTFLSPSCDQPAIRTMSDEAKSIIQNAVELLEYRQRQVITKIFLNGKRAREVASELGLSESYVAETKAAALLRLKHYLQDALDEINTPSQLTAG